jgi:excisionase family DNA binding protein
LAVVGASQPSPWLSLGQASRILGITPATLRRWADQGQVAAFVTPGGHRRFPRPVIEGLVPRLRARRPALARLGASPDRMARAYRRAGPGDRLAASFGVLSDADRDEFRERGRHLLAIVLEHLDAENRDAASTRFEEGCRAAAEYGHKAAALGASLAQTIEVFLRYRAAFADQLAAIARSRRLDTREATSLLLEAEAAMDRLLVALVNGHTGAA